MIDYAKIFKDIINENFEARAKEARERHPRPYTKQDTATFGLTIENSKEENLSEIRGQALVYTWKLADLLQNHKIKSIDIDIAYNPDTEGKYYAFLIGKLELEDR